MPRLLSCEFEDFTSYESGKIVYDVPGLVLVRGVNEDTVKATSNKSGKSNAFVESLLWGLYGQGVKEKSPSGSRLSTYSNDKVVRLGAKAANVRVKFTVGDAAFTVERVQRGATQRLTLQRNGKPVKGSSKGSTQGLIDGLLGTYSSFCHQVLFGQNVRRFSTATDVERKAILETLLPDLSVYTRARQKVSKLLPEKHREATRTEAVLGSLEESIGELQDECSEEREEYRESFKRWKRANDELEVRKKGVLDRIQLQRDAKVKNEVELLRVQKEMAGTRERDLKKLRKKLSELNTEMASLSTKLEHVNERLDHRLPNLGVVCGECEHPISSEHKQSLIDKYENARKNLCVRLGSTRKLFLKVRSRIGEEERSQEYRRQLESKRTSLLSDSSSRDRMIEELERRLVDVQSSSVPKPSRVRLDRVQAKLVEAKKRLKVEEAKFGNLQDDVFDLEFWHIGFGPSGIKSDLLNDVMPLINDAVGEFLSDLLGSDTTAEFRATTLQKSGKEVEKCDVVIHNENDQGYETASEGERRRLDLCIALALQSLSQNSFNIMICDEPFESVDEAGQSSIVGLLNEYAQKKGICVYVLTYLDDVFSLFSRKITVVRKDGVSRIEASIPGN